MFRLNWLKYNLKRRFAMEKKVTNVFAFIIASTPCIERNANSIKFVLTLTSISEKFGQET